MAQTLAAGWISGGWIYSRLPSQDARFWIHDNWIWGPVGADDLYTRHWIQDGWIFGPVGAEDVFTGFFIRDGWIFGPRVVLPFNKAERDPPRP